VLEGSKGGEKKSWKEIITGILWEERRDWRLSVDWPIKRRNNAKRK
jgi:hypothetical protein